MLQHTDENDLLCADFDDLSDMDMVVLCITADPNGGTPSRINRLAFLYYQIFKNDELKIRFSDGYSDELDESLTDLLDKGILKRYIGVRKKDGEYVETVRGIKQTDYGRKLFSIVCSEFDDAKRIKRLVYVLNNFSDMQLFAATSHFYGNPATPHEITKTLQRLIKKTKLDGIPLSVCKKHDFESRLHHGVRFLVTTGDRA